MLAAAAPAAADRQAGPNRHAVHPGRVFRASLEFGPIQKQPHEHFLGGVVGVGLVVQQAVANVPHPLAKPLDQFDERGAVGALAGGGGGKLFVAEFGDVHNRSCANRTPRMRRDPSAI